MEKSSISLTLIEDFFCLGFWLTKEVRVNLEITTKQLVLVSMFIALSFVGSLIKIPSPFGTVALDAAPAFLAAIVLGPIFGACVAFLGHIVTAINVGMPLTVLIHLLIAVEMAIVCGVVGLIYKKGYLKLALFTGLLLNGVAAPALFIAIPQFGIPFFMVMFVPLLLGAAVNIVICALIVRALKGSVYLEHK